MGEVESETIKNTSQNKNNRFIIKLIVAFVILGVTIFGCMAYYKLVIIHNYEENRLDSIHIDTSKEKAISVEIPSGSGTTAIANILKEKGIVKHPILFKFLSNIYGYDGTYKAGVHILNKGLDYEKIMRVLSQDF